MAIVEVSVAPLGTATTSVSKYVAGAVKLIQEEGVDYRLTPMGTILWGELNQLLALVGKMHESAFTGGVQRVLTTVKIDDRRDREVTPEQKVQSVEEKLKD